MALTSLRARPVDTVRARPLDLGLSVRAAPPTVRVEAAGFGAQGRQGPAGPTGPTDLRLAPQVIGRPDDGEVILAYAAPEALRFEPSRCRGRADVAPAAAVAFQVRKNCVGDDPSTGQAMGTAGFAAGSRTAVFAFADPTLADGDVVKVFAPAPADPDLETPNLTFFATRIPEETP